MAGAICLLGTESGFSQQWQPSRIPPESQAQPLHGPGAVPQYSRFTAEPSHLPARDEARDSALLASKHSGTSEQLGTGVVLRWRSGSNSSRSGAHEVTSSTVSQRESSPVHSLDSMGSLPPSNPLRQASSSVHSKSEWDGLSVRTASDVHPIDRFQATSQQSLVTRSAHYYQQTQVDPLSDPELAPLPPLGRSNTLPDPPSFPPQLGDDPSPLDRRRDVSPSLDSTSPDFAPKWVPDPSSRGLGNTDDEMDRIDNDGDLEAILERARQAATPDCVTQRDQLKGHPLSSISLDISPKLGDGLRSIKKQAGDDQVKKLDLQKKSLKREWTDYRGDRLGSGRLIDLRFGNVILDMDGAQQAIPVANLSDVDMNYISELWNLPFRCGSGYERLEGRQFVSSTVQWKASGACHNPLYFEQVQLERYGHETGPVLQPLISSAHYFLTIPMLPYKMAINPPNECQYALGYYRPGNCAPYMVPPFPWSVKAGLVQAGFWTGASALIP